MNIRTEQLPDNTWAATDADSYDGAPDSTTNYVGYGKTQEDAIEELKIQLEDNA